MALKILNPKDLCVSSDNVSSVLSLNSYQTQNSKHHLDIGY